MPEKLDRVMGQYAQLVFLTERLERAVADARGCHLCYPLPTADIRAAAHYLRKFAELEQSLLSVAIKAALPESEVTP